MINKILIFTAYAVLISLGTLFAMLAVLLFPVIGLIGSGIATGAAVGFFLAAIWLLDQHDA